MRQKGICKFWNLERGFGFLKSEGHPDTFVHVSEILKSGYSELHVNDAVSFEVIPGAKGPMAVDVMRIKGGGNGNSTC